MLMSIKLDVSSRDQVSVSVFRLQFVVVVVLIVYSLYFEMISILYCAVSVS